MSSQYAMFMLLLGWALGLGVLLLITELRPGGRLFYLRRSAEDYAKWHDRDVTGFYARDFAEKRQSATYRLFLWWYLRERARA